MSSHHPNPLVSQVPSQVTDAIPPEPTSAPPGRRLEHSSHIQAIIVFTPHASVVCRVFMTHEYVRLQRQ